MSTVTAGGNVPFDMLDADFGFSDFDSEITSATNTLIAVQTPSGHFHSVNGTFSYDIFGNITGGTITAMIDVLNGNVLYTITGFSMSLFTWGTFIVNNDAAGQHNFLLGGDDFIGGSAFNDRLKGFGGNDRISGGGGSDIAVFTGNRSSYTIAKANGTITVTDQRGIDGSDTLTDIEFLQFADGIIAANTLPVVSAANYTPGHSQTSVFVDTFVSISDPDGDPVQAIELFDNTPGGGRFRRNGVLQAENQGIVIAPSDFASYEFVTDGAVTNSVSFRAYDGTGWGAWTTINIFPRINALPTITASNLTPGKTDTFIAGANLFSVADGDGDAITRYKFYDGTAGNGRFLLNGAPQVELANFEIAASDLANFGFETSPAGASTLWVQANDGFGWGAWKSFNVAAIANVAPIASVQNLAPGKGTAFIAGSALVSVSDPDDANVVRYQFFDGTTGNGCFQLNGIDQIEQRNITVEAANFANFRFRTSSSGSDVLWVQAFDGTAWSAWKTFTVAAPANVAPTVNVQNLTWSKSDAFIAGANLFTVSDPDDAAATKYRFFDGTAGNGRLQLNGTEQVELTNIEINASDLANFRYAVGNTGVGDTLWVQAYDGFDWSAWKSFTVAAPPNNAPVVSAGDRTPAHGTTTVLAASLFSATDPDGDTIAAYRFFDGTAGSGHFRKNGVDQAELTNISVNVIDLVTTDFVLGSGSDVLWVQAFDGTSWGAWKSFTLSPAPNNAPVVTVNLASLTPAKSAATVAASSFFSTSDADGDTITHFRFFDGTAGNGRLETNSGSPLGEMQNILVNASDLANIRYRTSTTGAGDTLWVQAYDGTTWGAWKSFNVTAPANFAPVVNVHDITPGKTDVLISDSALYTNAFDADGDPITKFRFFDGTAGNGCFELNGAPAAELQNIEINTTDLWSLRFRTSNTGTGDTLWVQVYDGTTWSAWKSFNVSGWQNSAPVVSVSDRQGVLGFVAPASALFTVSDADNDTIARYQFWDSTPGQGHFLVNGVEQAVNTPIDIAASDLANTQYVVSSNDGSVELLWVRANDGTAWGEWKSLTITAVPFIPGGGVVFTMVTNDEFQMISFDPAGQTVTTSSHAPVVAAADTDVEAGTVTSLASLLSVSDPDGDPITAWQFWDATSGGGGLRIGGAAQVENQAIDVMAGQLAAADFLAGASEGTDQLWARASDGTHWGAWKPFTITTLAA